MLFNDKETQSFLEGFSQKSYVDIFNLRSRVEPREWERKAITDIKEVIFQKRNQFPDNKNVLYLHIPFCATRCDYCPYYTTPYSLSRLDAYLDALEREIALIKDTPYLRSTTFSSVYFGGGTPSLLNLTAIERLSNVLLNSFTFSRDAEFSFESNPATLNEDKIKTLKRCGFNRVSLGVQTFRDHLLKEMNCAHTANKALRIIHLLLDNGFTVNIDTIYGLIGQSKQDLEADLQALCSIQPPHQVTSFPLRIAKNTPLGAELERREGLSVKWHLARLLEYDRIIEQCLTGNDYSREECSVFYHRKGAPDHAYHSTETRVVGLGSSAGTLLDEGESSNYFDVDEYMSAIHHGKHTALSGILLTKRQAHERFVLYRILYSYRSLPDFRQIVEKRFNEYYLTEIGDTFEKVIGDMEKLRFIKRAGAAIVLTDRLWRILNKVKIGMPSIK